MQQGTIDWKFNLSFYSITNKFQFQPLANSKFKIYNLFLTIHLFITNQVFIIKINPMLSKALQNYPHQASLKQKQDFLRQLLLSHKNQQFLQTLKDLQSHYQQIFPILQSHPQITVQFIFQNLSIEDSIKFITTDDDSNLFTLQGYGLIRLLNQIGKQSHQKQHTQFFKWFSKMYSKYSSIEKLLVFMKEMSNHYILNINDQYLAQFLADFIKSSALCIQTYLKLKSQSPTFDIDYIEHGQKIVKYTQSWVKSSYLNLLKNLKAPINSQKLKIQLLNSICDIVGALMQVQREGNIESSICDQILQQSYKYIKKITSIKQFNDLYARHLKQNSFNIPHHKIVIPNAYSSDRITFPKPAYCYVMFRFIKQFEHFYSSQVLTNYLILLINQLCLFQYTIKSQVQNILIKTLDKQNIKTCFQGKIPLSIVWFNLWHNKQKGNIKMLSILDETYERIMKQGSSTYLNNLIVLGGMNEQGIEKEKNEFIGQKLAMLVREMGANEQRMEKMVVLLRRMDWENTSEKGEEFWGQVMKHLNANQRVRECVKRDLDNKKGKFVNTLRKFLQQN